MPDICSICLCTDIELQALEEPLNNFHDELCEFEGDKNPIVCPKCVYLLRKFYVFRSKCKRANTVLKKWKKQSESSRLPLSKLRTKLNTSLGLKDNESDKNNDTAKKDDTNKPTIDFCSVKLEDEDTIENNSNGNLNTTNNEDIFTQKLKIEKDIKDKKVKKSKEEGEDAVKVELDLDNDDTLDGLACVSAQLKTEQNNDDDDDDDDIVLNDDDVNDSDFNIDDAINNEVIKNCGKSDGNFDIEKLLKDALDSDSSDDEVLIKKRTKKVVSTKRKTEAKTVKKKVVPKKREREKKSKDDTDDEQPKKKRTRAPSVKKSIEETKRDVRRRLGNNDVKDKEGNLIEVDTIVNHLDVMHSYSYNKIKRYCAGKEPLSSEAIDFLGRMQKRYGSQYSSVFVTKHLTTDEEIMEDIRKRETNQNYINAKHKCTKCFKYFRTSTMQEDHIAEYHDPGKPYKCKYCEIHFTVLRNMLKHVQTHRVVYQCKLCPLVTNYTSVMETHFNIHKGVRRFPCTKCDGNFKSRPALASHMNSVHPSDFVCPVCARNFYSEAGLHQHKKKKHPDNVVETLGPPSAKCALCNVQFVSDEIYQEHKRKIHFDPKNIIGGVDMSKKRKPALNRKTPRYTCRVCNGIETSMGALVWHFKTEHPYEEVDWKSMALRAPYQYLCHECGKGFNDVTSFKDHKNVHTGARPYTCTECPKAFFSRNHLRNHLEFHAPPTHQCTHCGKKFHSKSNLNGHLRLPYGIPPSSRQCTQCGKKFHSKSNLNGHLRLHTGNRRYSCEVCGKTFLHQGAVNAHVRGVHLNIRRTKKPSKHHDLMFPH